VIVCIPSRGRPESLRRLFESIVITKARCDFFVRLDEDDPALFDSLNALRWCGWQRGPIIVGPRTDVAGAMQEALRVFPDEDCYALIGDDTVMRTFHWDEKLREAAGRWRIAYPDDGLKGETQATHPFIGGDFLRAIGFWGLPGLSHLFTDTVWDFLGRQYGNLVYCPQVLVEHMHWSAGKSERDPTYAKPTAAEDQRCFSTWSDAYRLDRALAERVAASAAAA